MMPSTQRKIINADHIDLTVIAKSATKMILVLAASGALLSLATIAPNLPKALHTIERSFRRASRKRLKQALRRLEKQHLVEILESPSGAEIILTEEGKKRVLKFNIEYPSIPKPRAWDGMWRIITFDIPEEFKEGRRALRWKFRELGFYPLQKSVFVYPYPCRDEIDFIADFYGVGRYLNYFEATLIDDEKFLRRHFQLS